jgi:hypothetical protein
MASDMQNDKTPCFSCKNRRSIPGDYHILCSKPDPKMTGNPHGIKNGWFAYPWNFDPLWKTKECSNFEKEEKEVQ